MKQRFRAESVKVTKNYLNVWVCVSHGMTKRYVTIKVPLRLINEIYQEFQNALSSEANDRLQDDRQAQAYLPLEKWE